LREFVSSLYLTLPSTVALLLLLGLSCYGGGGGRTDSSGGERMMDSMEEARKALVSFLSSFPCHTFPLLSLSPAAAFLSHTLLYAPTRNQFLEFPQCPFQGLGTPGKIHRRGRDEGGYFYIQLGAR
jgi:hypothetical protein